MIQRHDNGCPAFFEHGSIEHAQWLVRTPKTSSSKIGSLLPHQLAAYVRLDFAAWRVIPSDTQGVHESVPYPPDEYREARLQGRDRNLAPPVGSQFFLHQPQVANAVLEALSPSASRRRTTMLQCAFWEGGSAQDSPAPMFRTSREGFHLFQGPEPDVLDWLVERSRSDEATGGWDCPDLIWPPDLSWCLAVPYHSSFALLGGSARLVEAVAAIPGLYPTVTAIDEYIRGAAPRA